MLLFQNCFSGLNFEPTLSALDRRFKFVKHSLIKEGFRVFATYADAKSNNYGFQKDLADTINAFSTPGQAPVTFDGKNWQWHHVFERTHLEPLYNPQDINTLHEKQVPCVLINGTTEHFDYSGLLHTVPAKAVFGLPAKGGGILSGKAREDYKTSLASMYRKVYGRDAVLTTVFNNILRAL
jgi:hypothetical protein